MMNGFTHGSQGLQTRSNQAEFLGVGTVTDRQNLMLRGLAAVETQQGNAFDYNSGLTRSADRSDVAEAPVGFDFLGGHPQLIRSQHPGISQSHPRQQPGYNDMHLLQQQFVYRQLQEIQRQQQLQQLGQGAMQQNQFSQLSGIEKQVAGVPIHSTSNRMWSNELMGGDPKTPSSSQILVSGNMNWIQGSGSSSMHGFPNGLMYLHDHSQAMRSIGTVPQQIDQSLYGTPIINARGSLNCSQFPGISCEPTVTKADNKRAEKPDAFNFQNEDFQAKTLFGNSPVQNLNDGVPSGSFQQVNLLSQSVQAQDFQDRQEQPNWLSSTQQKSEQQEGLPHCVTNLDATEEKLLFSTDDDGSWNGNTSMVGHLHGTPLEGNDHFSGFPSIQSGSWSALMQEALGASSSDTVFQEEWGGSSVEKTALPTGNHSAEFDGNDKQHMAWDDKNSRSASSLTSKAFPLFNDADKGLNCPSAHNFEKSTKFACEQGFGVQHESFQEPAVETNKKQLDQSDQQKQFGGSSSLQAQMPFANFYNGVWTEQMRQQSIKSAADTEFSLQNVQGVWAQQQKMPLQNIDSHPNSKPDRWNINETLPPSGLNSLKVHDNDVKIVNAQRNDVKRITHLERDFNPAVTNSDTQRINQQMVSGRQDDFGKQVAIDSSVTRKGDQEPGGLAQPFDSSLNIREKRSCEMYGSKEENSHQKKVLNEGYTYDCSNASQHTDSGSSASKNSVVAGNGPHASVSGQKLSGQSGRKTLGSRKFQYHPMGNMEINMESASSLSHTSHSQGSSQLFVHGLNTHEQGYVGRSQFVVGHGVANNASDMGKRHSTELQKDAGGTVERPSVGVIRSRDHALSASFDGSNPQYDQNRRVGQSSQNMLELLHKVDQSRDSNTHPQFGYSDRATRSLATEVDPSDEAGSHLKLNQSSLQGVGLGLAPPSRAQPGLNPALPVHNSLQTADESGSRHADSVAGQKDRTFSLPPAHEVSQREDPNNVKSMSGQVHREASQPNIQGNYSLAASTLSHARNQQHQLQQQQAAHATGVAMMSQSANLSFGSRLNANEHVKQSSHVRQTHEAHGGAVSQALSSGVSGRVFPSRLASATTDNQAPVASQFHSLNVGLSRPINSIASHLRNTGKQLPLVEPRLVQSSTLSGTSQQQGAFSTTQQNTWTNLLAQRPFSGVHTQKTPPNLLHPMNQLSSSRITSPWFPQKTDDSNREKAVAPSELVTSPASSGQVTGGEEIGVEDNSLQQLPPEGVDIASKTSNASQGQKLLPKQLSDGNSVGSIPSLVHLHQQEHSGRRHLQDSSLDSQREHASLPNGPSSNHDTGAYGNDSKQSDVRAQNYSLLQQMQAMKGADSDLSKRVGKRLRGADSVNEASQMDWKTGQRYIYAQNTVFGHPGDGQLGASSQQSSFPSGVKMLSFSSTENEGNSSNMSPQLTGKPIPSQSFLASTEHDLQNHIHSFGTTSTSTSREGNEQPQISPHTAPTWFKQYGTYNNGQIRAMYDGFGSSQPIANAAAQNYFFGKASENRVSNVMVEQRNDASLVGSIWQSTSSLVAAANSSHYGVPLDVTDNNTVLRLKKRKSLKSELLPWHKEVAHGSKKLRNISMAELEWTRAANRLVEKVEEEFEMTEDGPALPRPRRRLIFTTQLMQQLFPSVPARILRANASTSYESVTYFVAKFALGDACSLICCSGSDSHVHNDSENMVSERIKSPEKVEDHIFSKIVENFVGRARKLENDLLRLDKRVSILDLKMECQDLERCSIINRFAKFHGRAQTDGVESSSTFEFVQRRPFPQRQAVAVPMPRNLPEGVLCLSL